MTTDVLPKPGRTPHEDASIEAFNRFIVASLSREPSWSDMILHGQLDGVENSGLARWRLPSSWEQVLGEGGDAIDPFDSATLQWYMEKFRDDPTAFGNGDSLRLSVTIDDDFRLRLVFFSMGGRSDHYALEMRRIERKPRPFDKLEVPTEWRNLINESNKGLFLVTGPTCAGKTSTCYSVLEHFNLTRAKHILTIEDPIENILTSKKCVITQTEVGPNGASFSAAMNGALVKAPNIIFIGEIKDADTARAAIHASDSGHLVFGTLHTSSCETAVERMISLAGESNSSRKELAANLRSVLCQALVPTIDGLTRQLVCDMLINGDLSTSRSGTSGTIRSAIQDGNIDMLRQAITSRTGGSLSMNIALSDRVRSGKISKQAAMEAANHQPELLAMLVRN